jgi:Mn2+/Fe2+ NRAMP family transporter
MEKRSRGFLNRFWSLVISIGPAFFLVGYTIGSGSIVSMASAGSRYGMSLLWAVALACIFCFVLMEAYGRYSLVTGEGSLFGIRKNIPRGRLVALTILVGLVMIEIIALAGNMGIVSSLINEWSRIVFGGEGWEETWVAATIALLMFGLIMVGKFSFFEKVLIVFVSVMGLSFFLTMFVVLPEPQEIVRGLLLSVPHETNAPMIVAAIIGTTFSAPTFVVRGILMKEKKWKSRELKHARKDAAIGAFMMFLISASVMSCAAGTLYIMNQPVDKVVAMVALLEPLLGRFSVSVFVSGIIGAVLSSLIPILMLAPMLVGDYRGKEVNFRSPVFRVFTGVVLILGLAVPVFNAKPVFAMLLSMVFQVFVLPVVIAVIFYLINRKDLMGTKRAGILMNGLLILSFLFSLVISYQGVVGLIESMDTVF